MKLLQICDNGGLCPFLWQEFGIFRKEAWQDPAGTGKAPRYEKNFSRKGQSAAAFLGSLRFLCVFGGKSSSGRRLFPKNNQRRRGTLVELTT
jgi:hypothetical protein